MTNEQITEIKDGPLISVIVPVYKTEEYIHRCVESILQQTYRNLEIILVDDGSPDQCGDICDAYSKADGRVKVIHQKNGGLSAARNAGLKKCCGDFITFVDSDDYIQRDMLETLYSNMDDADYISCGFYRVTQDDTVTDEYVSKGEIVKTGMEMLYGHYDGTNGKQDIHCVYAWGKLYRKKVWEGLFFTTDIFFEDIDIMPYVLMECKKVMYIPYIGYFYRNNANSITNNVDLQHQKKLFEDSFKIWEKHMQLYKEKNLCDLMWEVEHLKIEKILSHVISDSIPENLDKQMDEIVKNSIKKIIKTPISFKLKIRYLVYLTLGKKQYIIFRNLLGRRN